MSIDEVIAFARGIRQGDPQRASHLTRAMRWAFSVADDERASLAPLEPATVAWASTEVASDVEVEVERDVVRARDAAQLRALEPRARESLARFDRAIAVGLGLAQQRLYVEDRSAEAADVLFEIGLRQTQLGVESGAALTRFIRAFPQHPRVAEAYFTLGVSNMAQLRLDVARALFERALSMGVGTRAATAQMLLARIALLQSRLDDALALAVPLLRTSSPTIEDAALRIVGASLAESATSEPQWNERVERSAQTSRSPRALVIVLESMLYARVDDEPRQRAIIALFERVLARDRTTFCAVREEEREDLPLVVQVIARVRALRVTAGCER